jgi:hypothetical protein
VLEPFKRWRPQHAPVDCRTRLLLDPYLCVGPGCEAHAATLFAVSQQCAALGITLCVERQAWLDAERDPDVVRRRVDLGRFEPVVKLDSLPLPTGREAAALFITPRSETDVADLKLLGALHARQADHLVALDGRIHALAARAGLSSRVLTPADALHWLGMLAGSSSPVMLREIDPRSVAASGLLAEIVREECEPYDPYLRGRLEAGRGRVLVTWSEDEPLAIGVVETAQEDGRLELVALAARETERGARALEPILSAALAMARRRGQPLVALLPPHEEMALRLLDDLGFSRDGQDRHGRECWSHHADPAVPRLGADAAAWLLPLDAQAHDLLLPEMSGAAQAQLFAVGADSRPQTLGSPVRKQVILAGVAQAPSAGDLLMFFHTRSPRRPASASVTGVARIERVHTCSALEEVLALNATRPGYTLEQIGSRLEAGPVTVLDLALLGRLERFLTLARMKELDVLGSAPRAMKHLPPEAWQHLSACLALA